MPFLVDENLPSGIVSYLRSNGHDVLDVAASPLRGSADKTLWALSASEKRIIITRDLDFPFPGVRPFPAGVILLRVPTDFTAPQITELFKKSFESIPPGDLGGCIAVISPGRIRVRLLP